MSKAFELPHLSLLPLPGRPLLLLLLGLIGSLLLLLLLAALPGKLPMSENRSAKLRGEGAWNPPGEYGRWSRLKLSKRGLAWKQKRVLLEVGMELAWME